MNILKHIELFSKYNDAFDANINKEQLKSFKKEYDEARTMIHKLNSDFVKEFIQKEELLETECVICFV